MKSKDGLAIKLHPYLSELERFKVSSKDSNVDNKSTFTISTIQILEKMYEDLRYLNKRQKLVEKFEKNRHSREALIPKEERIKKRLYEENSLTDKLKEWASVYGLADNFIDRPKETAALMYTLKLQTLLSRQKDYYKLSRHPLFRSELEKSKIAFSASEYLLGQIDGFGLTPKMVIDSASLKIFLLYTVFTDAKPYTMKRIIEGVFANLGYRLELKLDNGLAKKALPIAYFNNSLVFAYPIRQKDSIFTETYLMMEAYINRMENDIAERMQTETHEERKNILLELQSRLSNGFIGLFHHMLLS